MLTNMIRTQDFIIKNTFFEKPPKHKATYIIIGMQLGPPWTPNRYEEIDHCIVRDSWKNTVADIQTEPSANVNTDHFTMIATIKQKLKANEEKELEINLKNIYIGPDTDDQGNINPSIVRFNDRVHELLTNSGTNIDVGNITETMKKPPLKSST